MKIADKKFVAVSYDLYVKRPSQSDIWTVSFICSSEDNVILTGDSVDMTYVQPGEWVKMSVDVPDNDLDMFLTIRMPLNAECYIFGVE